MANKIEWLQLPGYIAETWNPVTGCTKVSAGCANCWAEKMSKRMAGRYGYPISEPFKVTVHKDRFNIPFTWKKPRMVFVCSMGDLFHESITNNVVNDVFRIIEDNPEHLFLVLTKRPARMWEMSGRWGPGAFPNNLWFGVSVENQETANQRIPCLLRIPANKRFISCEPLLGKINLKSIIYKNNGPNYGNSYIDALTGSYTSYITGQRIDKENYFASLDWVIAGGESGPHARPMHPDWVRSIRDQCKQTGTPLFFKQWGAWMPESQIQRNIKSYEIDMMGQEIMHRVGKKHAGRVLGSEVYSEYPTSVETGHCPVSEKQVV